MSKPSWRFPVYKGILLAAMALYFLPRMISVPIMSAVPFEQVQAALLPLLDENLYSQQSKQSIRRIFNIDPASVENIAFLRSNDALNAQELVLIEFNSQSDIEALQSSLEQRQASQVQIYEGYAPEAYALSQNALLDIQGNYGLYYVGENTGQVDEAFLSALKEG